MRTQPGELLSDAKACWMCGRRRESLKLARKACDLAADPKWRRTSRMWLALAAAELGEDKVRDEALQKIVASEQEADSSYCKLAPLMLRRFGGGDGPDLDFLRELIASRPSSGARVEVAYTIAWYLEVSGQRDDAVEFYRRAASFADTRSYASHSMSRWALRRLGVELKEEETPAAKQ